MKPSQDHLTLEALLSDPLTRLVMRSDNITVCDTARAFGEARAAVLRNLLAELDAPSVPVRRAGSSLGRMA